MSQRISLENKSQEIRVQLWRNGTWRYSIHGQVIGSYDGIVGVLLDSGEYMDVPEDWLRIVS